MSHAQTNVVTTLREAHRALKHNLVELEDAVTSSPPAGPAELGRRLAAVETHLLQHFAFEEDQEGYMNEVRKRAPHQDRTIQHLLQEHVEMADALRELQHLAAGAVDDALRAKVRAWVNRVYDHEARENLLVQETFVRDIGNKD